MGKAKSKKREEKAAEEGDYEFQLPDFDEQAFIRREVATARASFWTLGLGFVAGIVAYGISILGIDWKLGWLAIIAAMSSLKPMLTKLDFSDEVTETKALLGSYFMLFFTALGIWLLIANLV